MQTTHRMCTISSGPCRPHGKASCVLWPPAIYIHCLYTKQHSWLQRNKGSGEQTAGNGQMEEDLGQPNTINLSAYCQDAGSRILGIFLSEHLGQLTTQLIGAEFQQWKTWKCFLPQKRSSWQCGWRPWQWVSRFVLLLWQCSDSHSLRVLRPFLSRPLLRIPPTTQNHTEPLVVTPSFMLYKTHMQSVWSTPNRHRQPTQDESHKPFKAKTAGCHLLAVSDGVMGESFSKGIYCGFGS